MKKLFFLCALTLIFTSTYAQTTIRLNAYSSYVFDDKFDTYYSNTDYVEGKVKGGYQWGLGIEAKPREDLGVELVYIHLNTEAPVSYYLAGPQNRTIPLGVSYVMLGGTRYVPTGKNIEPYANIMLGTAIFNNKEPIGNEENSAVKFAWGARLGTNIWATEKVGLKLQIQILSAVQSLGGGLYFGTGGAGAGVSTYSTLYQFSVGGGLVFKVK